MEDKIRSGLMFTGLVAFATIGLSAAWFLGFTTGRSTEYDQWNNNGPQMQEYLQENNLELVTKEEDVLKMYSGPLE